MYSTNPSSDQSHRSTFDRFLPASEVDARGPFLNRIAVARLRKASRYLMALATLLLLLLAGCASDSKYDDEEQDESKSWPVEKLFTEAKKELKSGDYTLAIQYFETLQARFPFGKFAQQAQLEAAYAYYLSEEYDSAIASANRFIRLNPTHPKVDYAYYLRGLSSFHKKDTSFDAIMPQDPSTRDPGASRESFNYFAELVKKFPKSKYVPDAIKRMKFQRNTLAKHELNIASFYFKRGAYVAAANRAKYVVENYPRTPAIPNALLVMTKAYEALEMDDLAKNSRKILNMNYPNFENNPSSVLKGEAE